LDGIYLLVNLLESTDEQTLEKTCICLTNLSQSNSMNQVIIRQVDGIAPLLELMYHKNNVIQKHAANALSNLLTDSKNKAFIAGILPNALTHIISLKNGGIVASNVVKIPRQRDRVEDEEQGKPEKVLHKDLGSMSGSTLFSSFFKRN
jgi:hypothetical protein